MLLAVCRRLALMLLGITLIFQAPLGGYAGAQLAHSPERPPNILLILADDLGYADVGFNGRKEWRTPNIDRLARQGTILNRCYAASMVCGPSRAALMTGRYGIHNGVTGNNDDIPDSETTLAQALKARGYETFLSGKWHHGRARPGHSAYRNPLDLGFDGFFGFTDAGAAHQKYPKTLFFGRDERPVEGYSETLFTDRAIEYIRAPHEKPFFLYLAYTNPHFAIEAPKDEVKPFRGRFAEKPGSDANAAYAAMVSHLDSDVGRVLGELERLHLADNTLVLFSSDQGATFESGNRGASNYHDSNRPFRGQKRTVWEGCIRVPTCVRWPGRVPAHKVSQEPVHFIDVLPTLLAAAGGAPDAAWQLDGRNVLGVWEGREKAPERALFWEWRSEGGNQLAAMRGNMKLVVTGSTPAELFDVVADPAERRDIAAEHAPMAQRLRRELTAWLATEGETAKWGKSGR